MCSYLVTMTQLLRFLATIAAVKASMLADEPMEAKGLSLMQSVGSILPGISTQGTDFVLNDGLVDKFAAMEDEFDAGYVEVLVSSDVDRAAPKDSFTTALLSAPIFNHVTNPYLYVETLLVIAILALATRTVKWVLSRSLAEPQETDLLPKGTVAASSDAGELWDSQMVFAAVEAAVRSGNEAECLEALRHGGQRAIHQEDPYGCTALHIAAHCGSAAMVRLLLERGAKVDAYEAWDETPLHFAARSGSFEVCKVLLDHGASIDATNAYGWTPLLAAGYAKQQGSCEFLLSHGAGAGEVDETDLPPLVSNLIVSRIFSETTRPVSETSDADDDDLGT